MEVKVSDPDLDPDPVRIWRFCLDPDPTFPESVSGLEKIMVPDPICPESLDPKPWWKCYFPEEIMTDQPTDKNQGSLGS